VKVTTVEEIKSLDQRATTEFGIPDYTLMENAGHAVYFVILREFGVRGRHFVVISGPGNNGGDGLVVARKLRSSGGKVHAFVLGAVERYGDAAMANFEMLSKSGAGITIRPTTEEIAAAIGQCDAVVDGLLGTGLTREVGGQYRKVIEGINCSGKPVFSIDMPSGVDGNTGDIHGVAVRADSTITFGLPKRGNLLYPGAELGGRLFVSHISFPPQLTSAGEIEVMVSEPAPLPPRAEETQQLERRLTPGIREPLLVDGDDLTAVAGNLGAVSRRGSATILTLQAGEMSRIAEVPVAAVNSNPIPIVQRTAADLGAIVVLEGAHSLIGCPDQRVYIDTSGNPGTPTARSSDALKETIGAMAGLEMPVEDAVRTGVFLHGFAGELAGREKGEDGITALDILEHLPAAIRVYREDYVGTLARFYDNIEVV
jgi:hydroxyethylthiazole kinase-like uncharacterized protein yjeF